MKKRVNTKTISIISIVIALLILGVVFATNFTFAITIPDVLDHLPESANMDAEHLQSGRYDENKILQSDVSSLGFKYLVKMNSNSLRVILPDTFLRMEVLEFDSNYEYLGITDMATYDYFTKKSNTEYLLLSFYKSDEYGEKVESNYEELYNLLTSNDIIFEEIDDINSEEILNRPQTGYAYLSYKSLLNGANIKMGSHNKKPYAIQTYSYNETYATLRQNYKVVPGHTYYLSFGDSRLTTVYFSYLDKNQKWMDNLTGYIPIVQKKTFTIPDNINYIMFNYAVLLDAQKKYNINDIVFKSGGRIAVSSDDYYFKGTLNEDVFPNISDKNMWHPGKFGYTGGEYYGTDDSYASRAFYTVVPKGVEYKFKASLNYYKLKIVEVDSEGNNIGETTLSSDMHFKFNNNTYRYSMVLTNIYNPGEEHFLDYFNALDNGLEISFSPYEPYQYNTQMEDITSQEMIQRMGVGWNLGNSFDSKKPGNFAESTQYEAIETVYKNPYVAENVIEYVKSLGFNTIRIPITYVNNWYYDENGNYIIREEFLDRIQEVVNYAIKRNMYVVINTHFDSGMTGSPIYVGKESSYYERSKLYAKNVWTQIANRFKDYDEHLMFEAYNEVDNLVDSRLCTPIAGAQMNELNQLFVDTVRNTGGNNEKRILQLQTFLSAAGIDSANAFEAPKDLYPNKLMTQVHIYPGYWDEKLEEIFSLLDNLTQKTGMPTVVGEFSITNSTSPTMYKYTIVSNFFARAKKHNIAVILWDNNGDRILVDRTNLTVDQEYLNAIMKPSEYNGPELTWLDQYDYFKQVKMDTNTHTYKEQYDGWGTMQAKVNVEPNKKFMRVSEIVKGDANQRFIHYIYFYDENDNYLRGSLYEKYPGFKDEYLAVPPTASYVLIGIYSSHYKTTVKQYKNYFEQGLIKVGYYFENPEIDRTIIDTPINAEETKLTNFDDFEWGQLYTDTGEVAVNIGWGAITTDYIEIPDNKTQFYFNFLWRNSAVINPRYLSFYDENKQYINTGNIIKTNKEYNSTYDIVENAKYVRLGLTAFSNIGASGYRMMFASGDAALIYGFK